MRAPCKNDNTPCKALQYRPVSNADTPTGARHAVRWALSLTPAVCKRTTLPPPIKAGVRCSAALVSRNVTRDAPATRPGRRALTAAAVVATPRTARTARTAPIRTSPSVSPACRSRRPPWPGASPCAAPRAPSWSRRGLPLATCTLRTRARWLVLCRGGRIRVARASLGGIDACDLHVTAPMHHAQSTPTPNTMIRRIWRSPMVTKLRSNLRSHPGFTMPYTVRGGRGVVGG